MPKRMSKLKHLNLLGDYIVGEHEENGIRELGPIDVHGSFCISNLENVNNSSEALEAMMGNKKHINFLELQWSSSRDTVDVQNERDILEALRPHSNLKELFIEGYRNLEIFELDGLERIGEEFYKSGESCHEGTPFRSLERLAFSGMKGWREWHIPDKLDVFPKLKTLIMRVCPVLSGDLPAHLPALENLQICSCKELAYSQLRAPKLHRISINSFGRAAPHEVIIEETQQVQSVLEWLLHIQPPCIQHLRIESCWSAISISRDYLPASLQYLTIWDCSKLTFPETLEHKLLTEINVYNCDSVTSFPLGGLPNLKKLTISNCPEIDCFGEECLPPSLTTLEISKCQKIERWITSNGFHSDGLTLLRLQRWNEVNSFPTEGCLPASLQSLQLYHFPNLETLDCKGLQHLTSLKNLRILLCPRLENITEERLPASISKLYIYGECPLMSKLQEMNDPRIQIGTDDDPYLEDEYS
ncbi:hypothetical protein PIB30_011892 [Stylosanthes scabra]|uniref:R13L1/DRL21-like LRR repeat region domain-containing protein n=1 Tax=Stylosanthes scabra TaxID=79078 RepID=A0ABU6V7R8_9FABA|nr:hypothetical protein [Stylosanthes scabra]